MSIVNALESPIVEKYITTYPQEGSKTVKTGIIAALSETHRRMKAIDEIEIEE